MTADLEEKTDRYGTLLTDALGQATIVPPAGSPLRAAAEECLEMAESYRDDGEHFRAADDPVNALAAFSYGYGWLDAGVRIGLFDVPDESSLFTT